MHRHCESQYIFARQVLCLLPAEPRGIPHFVRDDNLVLIKKVSGENFTGKILTANLLISHGKCVIPNEVRDLSGLIMNTLHNVVISSSSSLRRSNPFSTSLSNHKLPEVSQTLYSDLIRGYYSSLDRLCCIRKHTKFPKPDLPRQMCRYIRSDQNFEVKRFL